MQRRTFIAATGATTAALAGLTGCIGGGSATGTLGVRVSDRPGDIDDFDTLPVTVAGVWVKPTDGERTNHEFAESEEVDLVNLAGDASALVGEVELDAGEYEYLQLDVTAASGTLAEGGDASVTTPGDAPLKFAHAFEVREGERTTFTADFTPVKQGQSGGYTLQPVADEVTVTYEDATDTGAQNGTATATETQNGTATTTSG